MDRKSVGEMVWCSWWWCWWWWCEYSDPAFGIGENIRGDDSADGLLLLDLSSSPKMLSIVNVLFLTTFTELLTLLLPNILNCFKLIGRSGGGDGPTITSVSESKLLSSEYAGVEIVQAAPLAIFYRLSLFGTKIYSSINNNIIDQFGTVILFV